MRRGARRPADWPKTRRRRVSFSLRAADRRRRTLFRWLTLAGLAQVRGPAPQRGIRRLVLLNAPFRAQPAGCFGARGLRAGLAGGGGGGGGSTGAAARRPSPMLSASAERCLA